MFITKIIRQIRTNIFTGFLLIIPLGATVFILKWLWKIVDNLISKNWFPGVGILVILGLAFFTGLLAKNYFGKMLIETGNAIITNIPLLNKIYIGVQQILDGIIGHNKKLFDRPILIEYPKKNSYCIGFVTSNTTGEIPRHLGEDTLSVFVPTTPNPTSGFLLFLPSSQIIELDMSVETAIKTVMSAGMVNPDIIRKTNHMYILPKQLKNWSWLGIFKRKKHDLSTHDPRD